MDSLCELSAHLITIFFTSGSSVTAKKVLTGRSDLIELGSKDGPPSDVSWLINHDNPHELVRYIYHKP